MDSHHLVVQHFQFFLAYVFRATSLARKTPGCTTLALIPRRFSCRPSGGMTNSAPCSPNRDRNFGRRCGLAVTKSRAEQSASRRPAGKLTALVQVEVQLIARQGPALPIRVRTSAQFKREFHDGELDASKSDNPSRQCGFPEYSNWHPPALPQSRRPFKKLAIASEAAGDHLQYPWSWGDTRCASRPA